MTKSLFSYAEEFGYINKENLNRATAYQQETKVSIHRALLDTKVLTEESLLDLYHDIYGYDLVQSIDSIIIHELILQFSRKRLLDLGMIPQYINDSMIILTCNPSGILLAEDYIKEITDYHGSFEHLLITESNLQKLINKSFGDAEPEFDIGFDIADTSYNHRNIGTW